MKIILSPAKTLRFADEYNKKTTVPFFNEQSEAILEILRSKSVEELMAFYKIKEKQAQSLYVGYQNPPTGQRAIDTYSGIVFQQIHPELWNDEQTKFALEHTYILDALYGALRLHDGITSYRLDMGHSKILESGTLSTLWKKQYASLFEKESLILNLSSNEFSKLVPSKRVITIQFMDWRDGKYKSVNTYVKMARGAFYNEVVLRRVSTREALKEISVMDYVLSDELSDISNFVYVR